ncbi:MAG: ABC transporter permease [Dongiaceae bacterium]
MIVGVLRRLLLGIVTLWITSILVFAATELLPGDVATAILGQQATAEAAAAIREQLGLDRSPIVRYADWLSGLVRGDFGTSLASRRPVAEMLESRLSNTLMLAVATALVAVPLSLAIGLLGAANPDSWLDRGTSVFSLVVISAPEFFIGAVFVLLFAVHWGLFPAVTSAAALDSPGRLLHALTLPVLTLTMAMLAHMVRMTRAAVLDVLRSPYIEMAILKGASKLRIVLRHALPNALGPIANVVALNLGYLISGVVVVETVFTYPGLGRLMVDAVASRDIPVVQATALIFCAAYVVLNIVADSVSILANPRLRFARR